MVNYLALGIALLLSVCSAFYSVMGMLAIFPAAPIPILIMGSLLEASKVTAISWVYRNWTTCPRIIKYYLLAAIIVLMSITSMGTFGYLSKAHSDHSLISGDSQAKVIIYDDKIRVLKETMEANRKALKQLDEAVDQVMARSSDEQGADKAVALRRSQQKERSRLYTEIETGQKEISALNEARAPFAAELRKVESEVGPIKYIARLFTSNPDNNALDTAVMVVIIMIVAVFDPLAVVLLIAANHGLYGQPLAPTPIEAPVIKQPPKPRKPSWVKKTSELIDRRKKGIIEIDKSTVMKMK